MTGDIPGMFAAETLGDLHHIAEEIIRNCGSCRVVALSGEMGAGKTTLIKAICHVLGVMDVVQSPTFSIINEYHTGLHENIYHFDFYRIKKLEEVFDIGYEEYFYSGAWCFIEWPELIEALLPENVARITIEGTTTRQIKLTLPPHFYDR